MKYAYIIGSNAFVVPSNVVSYTHNGEEKEFLKVNSVYHHLPPSPGETVLNCDILVKDSDGEPVIVLANQLVTAGSYTVQTKKDSIMVLRQDGSTLVHIHQLEERVAMSLEHNITAELEVNMPVAVIRIFGDFMLDGLHVMAENEKLFLNKNVLANSVLPGKHHLLFTEEGVVL